MIQFAFILLISMAIHTYIATALTSVVQLCRNYASENNPLISHFLNS